MHVEEEKVADWKKLLKDVLLADGIVDSDETECLKAEILADGIVDAEEVDFLVELRNGAKELCPEFISFFFDSLESNILEDGVVDAEEVSKLREILYADGVIDDDEKAFLVSLKEKAKGSCPEFDALCIECLG